MVTKPFNLSANCQKKKMKNAVGKCVCIEFTEEIVELLFLLKNWYLLFNNNQQTTNAEQQYFIKKAKKNMNLSSVIGILENKIEPILAHYFFFILQHILFDCSGLLSGRLNLHAKSAHLDWAIVKTGNTDFAQ